MEIDCQIAGIPISGSVYIEFQITVQRELTIEPYLYTHQSAA